MSGKYIATIDCGSSNVRCILFDMETGRQVGVSAKDWYVPQNSQIPGAYNFDAKKNWGLVCECMKSVVRGIDPNEIMAVTTCGFRHGIFCLDERGEVVYGCFNMDSRIDGTYIEEHNLAHRIFDITGDWPTLHALPRLLWIKRHDPEAFQRIKTFVPVAGWITYQLCGELAIEPGDASCTLLFDLKKRVWSKELCAACQIPESILPRVVDAGTVLGQLGDRVAQEMNLSPKTPVVTGVADTQAGLLGVGASGTNNSAIVGGTYWLDCHITDTPVIDPLYRTRTSCHCEPNRWMFEGVGFYVGLTVRWFRDAFGAQEKEIAKQYGLNPYALLDSLTVGVPAGSYGLQVLLSGVANQQNWRMCAPTFMGWDILDPEKSHKGVFFKAILENACYQAYGEYENIRRMKGDATVPRELILCGGAAQSPTWCQILSDVMGRPVTRPVENEGSALGAAILAAAGVGWVSSIGEGIQALVHKECVYEPDLQNHRRYLEEYARWQQLYENGLTLLDRGLVKSMWQPGSTLTSTQKENPWQL